jgi:hypothetical protein
MTTTPSLNVSLVYVMFYLFVHSFKIKIDTSLLTFLNINVPTNLLLVDYLVTKYWIATFYILIINLLFIICLHIYYPLINVVVPM